MVRGHCPKVTPNQRALGKLSSLGKMENCASSLCEELNAIPFPMRQFLLLFHYLLLKIESQVKCSSIAF